MKKQELRRKINRARFLIIDLDEAIDSNWSRNALKLLINDILEALADDTKVKK